MNSIVWAELGNMKFLERYLSLYLDVLKRNSKISKALIVTFSCGGVLGWQLWDYAPLLGAALVAVIQLFTVFQEHLFMSGVEITKVSDMRMRCIFHLNQLEMLWVEHHNSKIDDDALRKRFYEIRQDMSELHRTDNEINLPVRGKLSKIAHQQAIDYVTVYFNLSSQEADTSGKEDK